MFFIGILTDSEATVEHYMGNCIAKAKKDGYITIKKLNKVLEKGGCSVQTITPINDANSQGWSYRDLLDYRINLMLYGLVLTLPNPILVPSSGVIQIKEVMEGSVKQILLNYIEDVGTVDNCYREIESYLDGVEKSINKEG